MDLGPRWRELRADLAALDRDERPPAYWMGAGVVSALTAAAMIASLDTLGEIVLPYPLGAVVVAAAVAGFLGGGWKTPIVAIASGLLSFRCWCPPRRS